MTDDGRGHGELRLTMRATVTPLASIFGSGFLIIVPALERTVGAFTVVAVIAISAAAWCVGAAIRHVIRNVEPLISSEELDGATLRLERISDLLIAAAYIISVALYVRIMAAYIVDYASSGGSPTAERALASSAILLITGVGVVRGFDGLEFLERLALGAVLVLTTALGGALFFNAAGDLLGSGIRVPPVPHVGIGHAALVIGGLLITVQGFETARYLGEEYDAGTRVRACWISQAVAASIYVGFALVCTPFMGIGTAAGPDPDLLAIADRVVPILALPLVACAVLSQFSAATADSAAAGGNLHTALPRWFSGARPYALGGAVAILLAWTVPTFTIIAVASRAFAAYYCAQCLIAARTTARPSRRAGFAVLAALMAAITLLAQPVG